MLKIINYKLYFLIVSFFILILILNCGVYKIFENYIKLQDFILLDSYKVSIERSIGSDIKIIDGVDTEKEQIFILQNIRNNNAKKSLINMSPIGSSKFLYYEKKESSIFIDLKKLQESLDEILPSFIEYSLLFKNISINDGSFQTELAEIHTAGDRLNISLSLDKSSSLVKSNKEKILQIMQYSISISLIAFAVFLVSMLFQKEKYKKRIDEEIVNLNKARKEIKKIQGAKESKNKIDSVFIKKATEIYTKQEMENIEDNNTLKDNILNKIGNKDYVFPLMLKGKKKSKIEVDDFFKNLEKSFGSSAFKSKIEIDISTNFLDIICEKEILYQIVYSIASNIMMFLEDQNDEVKRVKITLLRTRIIFNYNGYPLSKDNIIKLSKHVSLSYPDIFCLTGRKLFNSIDYHQLTYEISSKGFDNKIMLDFAAKNEENSEQEPQIIEFNRKKRKLK